MTHTHVSELVGHSNCSSAKNSAHDLSGDIKKDQGGTGEGSEGFPGEPEAGDEAAEARGGAAAQGQAEGGAQGQEGEAGAGAPNQGELGIRG